jgi:hypothetical protein
MWKVKFLYSADEFATSSFSRRYIPHPALNADELNLTTVKVSVSLNI